MVSLDLDLDLDQGHRVTILPLVALQVLVLRLIYGHHVMLLLLLLLILVLLMVLVAEATKFDLDRLCTQVIANVPSMSCMCTKNRGDVMVGDRCIVLENISILLYHCYGWTKG